MIIIDSDDHYMLFGAFSEEHETRESSRLLEIAGADVMVSPLSKPASSESLIRQHIKSGAYLYHIMNVLNFVEKDINLEILSKMKHIGSRQNQCVLLYAGVMDVNKDGFIVVDNIGTKHNIIKVLCRLDVWNTLGGVSLNIIDHAVCIKFLEHADGIFSGEQNE
jgi:hypothetical protein